MSNAVALDFGRVLFGPVGGVVFAIMVAVSCFGALNGNVSLLQQHAIGLSPRSTRIDLYNLTTHPSSGTRRVPPSYVWQAKQVEKDACECYHFASGADDRVHRRRGWVQVTDQLFGGSVLVVLFLNCTS
jgi:hypothetical protein